MLEPQAWYSLRDLAHLLGISMALARFAVQVLSNLGLIATRPRPHYPWSLEVAHSALPWIACAVQLSPSWGTADELYVRLESLRVTDQQEGIPNEPEWYSEQEIASRLGLSRRDLWPTICILDKNLHVLQRRQHPPGVASFEIHRTCVPLLCHAATGRPDACQQVFRYIS
jgi:hypothetical protein